ncbi:MAG: trypsin-like peptidase domain-containing protein [Eubacteriales bacterium]|nr:trypsin-like peptidase domain-containing protein [Eubacteriales bacterium]
MKKLVSACILIICLMVSTVSSSAAVTVGVTLNSNPVSFNTSTGYPFIDSNNRTLVPLRQTMEAAGYGVSWDSANKVATVSDDNGTKVYVKIGDNYITKEIKDNGVVESSRIKNDTFAQIVEKRTFLPIRVVLEAFGASVSWDGTNKSVVVNTNGISSVGLTAEQVYAKYSSAVFYIEIYDAEGLFAKSGSGFFVDSNGTAITNYHVIDGASSAKITTTDGKTYNVEGAYGFDKNLDLAKIKVSGSGFPCVKMASSNIVAGGSKTYAIGSPLGLENSISEGIVSNPNRIIDNVSFIQFTTPISRGSSGGALFDQNGNVIGVTSGGFEDGQNLNIAIPINNVNKISSTNITKLSAIAAQNAASSVTLSASPSTVALYVGGQTDVIFSVINPDNTVNIDYAIADDFLLDASWGDWHGDEIPLHINAISQGSTSVEIKVYDDLTNKCLASKTIYVTVSKGSYNSYYSGYYPAPDFGAIFGVPVYNVYESAEGISYDYRCVDLETGNIGEYGGKIIASGFYYDFSFDDDEGNLVLVYSNDLYGLTLYTGVNVLNGTPCYGVTVLYTNP